MRRLGLWAALATFAPALLFAQGATGFEIGAFGQYTKYHQFTNLDNGAGTGGRLTAYLVKRLGLEYEGDFSATKSARVGNLSALNHRIDMMLYMPLGGRLNFFGGGGWTGTQYSTDTTKNQYDSGGNAVAGFKYCLSNSWTWRADVNADFKDPSDQTPSGQRTRTWNMRLGFGRMLGAGGNAANSPCYQAPPPPPPPAPAPAPAPRQEPPPPPPQPEPPPPPPPPPAPAPAPPAPAPAPPKPREIMTLRNAYFAFNKYDLMPVAKDTLGIVMQFLHEHPDAKIEVQGHTDNVGSAQYNQALSERRANSVKTFLVSQGIPDSRVVVKGLGKSQPIADNKTAVGRARNRRVVVLELPQ